MPLSATPPPYTVSSDNNVQWNLRALGLMATAGLVEFAAPPFPYVERIEAESDAEYLARRQAETERFDGAISLRIRSSDHFDPAQFERRVGGVKAAQRAADRAAFERTLELTDLRRPLHELLTETYALPERGIEVGKSQLSCPVTRRRHLKWFACLEAPLHPFERTGAVASNAFQRAIETAADSGTTVAWLSYDAAVDARVSRATNDAIRRLLERLASEGVAEFSVADEFVPDWGRLGEYAPTGFVIEGDVAEEALAPPREWSRVTVLGRAAEAIAVGQAQLIRRPFHLVIAPRSVASPHHPTRPFFETQHHATLEQFQRYLDQ